MAGWLGARRPGMVPVVEWAAMSATDLFAAIDAVQAEDVRTILAADPSLAGSRDGDGVSALMHAMYRNQRSVAEAIAERLPALDVFEATSLGRVEDVRRLLGADPTLAARVGLDRQWLHAVRLGFEHPETGDHVEYESTYPDDLARALEVIRGAH